MAANVGFEVEKGRLERTAPLLKQSQIDDMGSEQKRISETLNAPPHIRNVIQDRAQLYTTLKKLEASLGRDTPREYAKDDIDKAVKREAELREAFVADMCTQEEMRRNPPGAVDKHLAFEAKHKANIAEWKNIRRRLYVSGALESRFSERSLSNIEMFRPGGWATLRDIADASGASEAGASARLRELRSRGWIVERKRVSPGRNLWLYRLTPKPRDLFGEAV